MKEYGVLVQSNERIVEDRNIITSSSPETALDVAFRLLELLTNEENTAEVKKKNGLCINGSIKPRIIGHI